LRQTIINWLGRISFPSPCLSLGERENRLRRRTKRELSQVLALRDAFPLPGERARVRGNEAPPVLHLRNDDGHPSKLTADRSARFAQSRALRAWRTIAWVAGASARWCAR